MNNKAGSSLINFLLYISLSSFLLSCVFYVVGFCIIPLVRSSIMYKHQLHLHIMMDLFVRDVRSHRLVEWKKYEPAEIIWNNGINDIGWKRSGSLLKRMQGVYKDGKWHKKITSVVGRNIQDLSFNYFYSNEKIILIETSLLSCWCPNKNVVSFVAIRHGKNDA